MHAARRPSVTSILCLALGSALLAAAPARAAEGICQNIRSVAQLAEESFASLQKDDDGVTSTKLPGAQECVVEDGEYSCTWSGVKDPGARAASLGKEIAACFEGASLKSMDLLALHVITTGDTTITVLGGLEDKSLMVTIK